MVVTNIVNVACAGSSPVLPAKSFGGTMEKHLHSYGTYITDDRYIEHIRSKDSFEMSNGCRRIIFLCCPDCGMILNFDDMPDDEE